MMLLFWISLAVILYAYAGYPLLLALQALLHPRPVTRSDVTPPKRLATPCPHTLRCAAKAGVLKIFGSGTLPCPAAGSARGSPAHRD